MLRVPYMKNPFSLAFESYEMTNTGKAVVASALVSAVANLFESERQVYQEREIPYDQQCRKQIKNVLKSFMVELDQYPDRKKVWESYNKMQRREFLIMSFNNNNMSHLVPMLIREFLDVFLPI